MQMGDVLHLGLETQVHKNPGALYAGTRAHLFEVLLCLTDVSLD